MDCRFETRGVPNPYVYPSLPNSLVDLCSRLDTIHPADFFSPITESPDNDNTVFPVSAANPELDFVEFWNNNLQNYYGVNINDEAQRANNDTTTGNDTPSAGVLQQVLEHVSELPINLVRNKNRQKASYFMIATTLDKKDILKQLDEILEENHFLATELSFDKESGDPCKDEVKKPKPEVKSRQQNATRTKSSTRALKRKQCIYEKQNKHYKQRHTSKMRAQKLCQTTKNHISWIDTHSPVLDEENVELEKEIRKLNTRELLQL